MTLLISCSSVRVASIYISIRLIDCFTLLFYKKILKLLCGDLPKNLSHSRVDPQLAIGQLVDSVSEIEADWVIASQDCFGRLCNPVTSKYHSLHAPNSISAGGSAQTPLGGLQ